MVTRPPVERGRPVTGPAFPPPAPGASSAAGFDPELADALRRLARTPVLLVACDYDGVLAPIVADPAAAAPLAAAADAVTELAALPRTEVALVSGRARRDLRVLSGLDGVAHLVGTHGAEFDESFVATLPAPAAALLGRVVAEVRSLGSAVHGVLFERKPASVAVHVRNADPVAGAALLDAVAAGPARWPGVHALAGKMVLELAVVETGKGSALDLLRDRLGASAVFFAGDDVTDEKAFAVLREGDVGVKVGPGGSLAAHRVDDPAAVARLLTLLASLRRDVVLD